MPTSIPDSLADHPQLDNDHPTTDLDDVGLRRIGKAKIKIPKGPLDRFVGDHLSIPGVLARVRDDLTAEEHEDVREALAAESEATNFHRQVEATGAALIKNQREQWLDDRAVSLLRRAFPSLYGDRDEDPDAILTHAGFRSGDCKPGQPGVRDAFVLRLICLQLVIRRGIEIRETMDEQSGEKRFPLIIYTVQEWNAFRPEAHAPSERPPGAAVKQPLSHADQNSAKKSRKRRRDPTGDVDRRDQAAETARLKEALAAERSANEDRGQNHGPSKGTPVFPDLDHLPPLLPAHGQPGGGAASAAPSNEDVARTIAATEVNPADAVGSKVVPEVVAKHAAARPPRPSASTARSARPTRNRSSR